MVAKATFMVKTQTTWWRKIPQCNECLQIWHRRQQAKVQAGKEAGGLGRPPSVARIAMLCLSYQRIILRTALLSFCHWCKSAKASCLFHGAFACCILVLDLKAFMHLFVPAPDRLSHGHGPGLGCSRISSRTAAMLLIGDCSWCRQARYRPEVFGQRQEEFMLTVESSSPQHPSMTSSFPCLKILVRTAPACTMSSSKTLSSVMVVP